MIDLKNFIDKKVIIRGRYSGVQYGTLEQVDGTNVILKDSRRLWYWNGAASLTQLSQEGVKYPQDCKFTVTSQTPIYISDMIEILVCTDTAIQNIQEVAEWKI